MTSRTHDDQITHTVQRRVPDPLSRSSGEARHGDRDCASDRHRNVERRLDEPPGLRFFEDLRGKFRVERVTGAVRDQVPDHRIADEREVADRVENLVADEFVFESERVVEHAGFAEHDRVIERAAERQTVLPQHFDVLQERERSRRRDLFDEALFGDSERSRLMTQQRMVVADAVGDLEVI